MTIRQAKKVLMRLELQHVLDPRPWKAGTLARASRCLRRYRSKVYGISILQEFLVTAVLTREFRRIHAQCQRLNAWMHSNTLTIPIHFFGMPATTSYSASQRDHQVQEAGGADAQAGDAADRRAGVGCVALVGGG